MYAVEFTTGLEDAWSEVATFVPRFLAFLAILVVGWFIARLVARVVDGLLERVGFDRAVERGGVGQALAVRGMDASDLLAKVAKYFVLLITLQAAFGVFGSNPIFRHAQRHRGLPSQTCLPPSSLLLWPQPSPPRFENWSTLRSAP